MLVLTFLLILATQISGDVTLYEKSSSTGNSAVTHKSWYLVEHTKRGGKLYLQLDTYQTQTHRGAATQEDDTSSSTSTHELQNRFINWALHRVNELKSHSSSSSRPIVLDISVEKQTTTTPVDTYSMSDTSSRKDESSRMSQRGRSFVLFSLIITCIASWVIFILQAIKLSKKLRRQRRRQMKKKQKKTVHQKKGALTLPLLEHERAVKQ
eukprot:g4546.t1